MAFSLFRNLVVKCPKSAYSQKITHKSLQVNHTNNVLGKRQCAPLAQLSQYFSVRSLGNSATEPIKKAKKKPQSDTESDSDLEVLGHRGESDFWRRKMRTFHAIIDVNNDGVVSYDDFTLLTNRFIDLGHLTPKHTTEFKNKIKDLWEKRWGEVTPYNLVTVERFLEDMHHVLNDKGLVRRAHSFLPYLFRAVDKDQSGVITVEEYKLFFECLNLTEQDAILAFRAIDENGDGRITLNEFVKLGREYFLSEDETKISKYFWGPLVEH